MSYQRQSVYQVKCKLQLLINCRRLGPEGTSKDEAYKLAHSEGWFAIYGQDAKCPECREEERLRWNNAKAKINEAYGLALARVDSP